MQCGIFINNVYIKKFWQNESVEVCSDEVIIKNYLGGGGAYGYN